MHQLYVIGPVRYYQRYMMMINLAREPSSSSFDSTPRQSDRFGPSGCSVIIVGAQGLVHYLTSVTTDNVIIPIM